MTAIEDLRYQREALIRNRYFGPYVVECPHDVPPAQREQYAALDDVREVRDGPKLRLVPASWVDHSLLDD